MLLIATDAYRRDDGVLSDAAEDIIATMRIVIFGLLVVGGLLDGSLEPIRRSVGFRLSVVGMIFVFFLSVCTPLVR
jgi:hypothetical protein